MPRDYDNFKSLKRVSSVKKEIEKLIDTLLEPLHNKIDEEIFFPMDMYVDDGFVFIELEMPGVPSDTIELVSMDKFLELSGTKDTVKRKYKNCIALERGAGRFKKIVYIEKTVNLQKATAKMDEGILTIKVPLVQEKRGKKIININ